MILFKSSALSTTQQKRTTKHDVPAGVKVKILTCDIITFSQINQKKYLIFSKKFDIIYIEKKKEKNKITSPRQEIKLPCKKLGIQM